ncbi:MAG: serine--tRNA ligase [Proteobacteria bacterium]|nr:serine--tRNA ligase [Pseudomonadota bacterium]MDA1309716.1 serine--tRNA ligase [Pseudomonadota bacterium]
MHDIRRIREDGARFDAAMKRRGIEPVSAAILEADGLWRQGTTELQSLQQRRNEASKQIGLLKRDGQDASALIDEVASIKTRMQDLEEQGRLLEARLDEMLAGLPNWLGDDVPDGADEDENQEVRRVGAPPNFAFTPRDHVAIGEGLGLMDFAGGAKLSGARFVVLRGMLARLERGLANFMLDHQTKEYGYTEMSPPVMVQEHALYGTGQLPKFRDQQFQTTDGFWLIPTAEVPLTNLFADEILDESDLPLRLTAYTQCFRSEAGAAGRDTRGMIRMHQFGKVEMVSITDPEHSEAEHQRMTECAEDILTRLGLAFRTVVLCAGDTGFSAHKTYDIEVWLPGQDDGAGRYREISSCSNCGEFQARRMKARFRREGGKKNAFLHTLNGSGLAVGRTLVAVLENYQQADGSVLIPDALRPYMDGLERISPAA